MLAIMSCIYFIFLDGVGIGSAGPDNPFYQSRARFLPFFQGGLNLPDGTQVKAIDATLGIPGRPQSASGQTALFCGCNPLNAGGVHQNGYPNRDLRRIIRCGNLFSELERRGLPWIFANAYPVYSHLFQPEHAAILSDGSLRFSDEFPPAFRRRLSVTSCMMLSVGRRPMGEKEILSGLALYQDYTNLSLREKGLDLPEFSPLQAAEILFQAGRDRSLVLYEYFQTDISAHHPERQNALEVIKGLDSLVGRLLELLDPNQDTLLLCSDHGNLEDLSSRRHTLNPVPLLAWGRLAVPLRESSAGIDDLLPALLQALSL